MTAYRCSSCGNRTRFEVEATTTTRALHHFTLGGEERIEEVSVLERRVAAVTCRWCGHGSSVVAVDQGQPPPPS